MSATLAHSDSHANSDDQAFSVRFHDEACSHDKAHLDDEVGLDDKARSDEEYGFPDVAKYMRHLEKDICSHLQAEIQSGFTILTEKLVHEVHTLSFKSSGEECNMPTNFRNHESVFESIPEGRSQSSKRFHDSTMTEDSVMTSARSAQMQTFRDQVMTQIERHDRRILTYINSVFTNVRNRSLRDQGFPDNRLVRFVLGRPFTVLTFLVIALNAIWMAYECDANVGQQVQREAIWSDRVNVAFTFLFAVELALRIAALRMYFFFGNDWTWNWTDFGLVVASFPELVMHGLNLTYMRLIRLVKLSRAFRLIRLVKFFTSLREILLSLFFTLGCLFWSFVALALTTYIFALLFMQWFALQASDGVQYGSAVTDRFKSTWNAMLALFGMISGGYDWYEVMMELDRQSDYLSKNTLVFYIFFTTFGIVNVIIAVFVGRAAQSITDDEHLRVAMVEEHTSKTTSSLIQIFNEIDIGHEGRISKQQFCEYFSRPKAQCILQSHGLHLFELTKLWEIIDSYDGLTDDHVDLPSFVMCVMRLSGHAKSTDVVMLAKRVDQILAIVRRDRYEIELQIDHKFDELLHGLNLVRETQVEDDSARWSL